MVERQKQTRWFALLGLTVIFLYLCWTMVQPFLNILIWSIVLVLMFYPVHRRLLARTNRPSLSAILSLLLVLITVVVPLILVTTMVANQIAGMASNIQDYVQGVRNDPERSEKFHEIYDSINKYVALEKVVSIESLKANLGNASKIIVSGTINVIGGALGFVVSLFFVLFTMYYLFRDGHYIVEKIPSLLPLSEEQSKAIIARTEEVISASVTGVVVVALIQGILGGIMFAILGVPSAMVWGVVMTLLCTIPMLGAFVVWVPAAILLALTGHWIKAVILTAWGVFVIGLADNFLRPRLVGQRTRLHELIIFFSVLGGIKVFGVLGILLGPVIVAITLALLDVYRQGSAGAAPVESLEAMAAAPESQT